MRLFQVAVIAGGVLGLTFVGCASTPKGSAPQWDKIVCSTQPAQPETQPAVKKTELDDDSTLSDYLAYAALKNPDLKAAFHRWKAELERILQVTSLPDPRFTYKYFIEEVETRVGPQRQALRISQMFPWFGKLKLKGQMADSNAKAAHSAYEAKKLKLFYEVTDAYCLYYYLVKAVEIVRNNHKLVARLEAITRTRYKTSSAAHSNMIRAQVELAKLDDRIEELEELLAPAVARLNAALNRPSDAPLVVPQRLSVGRISLDDKTVIGMVFTSNPELASLAHQIDRRRHAVDLAKKAYYPDITLGLDFIDVADPLPPKGDGEGPSDAGKDAWIVSLSMNLPIWQEKYRAGEREAMHRYFAAVRARRNKENALSAEVRMALYAYHDAHRKVDLYGKTLIPKADQWVKATDASFRAGKVMFLDLIDAELAMLEFELSYERSIADTVIRLAELDLLVGEGLPRTP